MKIEHDFYHAQYQRVVELIINLDSIEQDDDIKRKLKQFEERTKVEEI